MRSFQACSQRCGTSSTHCPRCVRTRRSSFHFPKGHATLGPMPRLRGSAFLTSNEKPPTLLISTPQFLARDCLTNSLHYGRSVLPAPENARGKQLQCNALTQHLTVPPALFQRDSPYCGSGRRPLFCMHSFLALGSVIRGQWDSPAVRSEWVAHAIGGRSVIMSCAGWCNNAYSPGYCLRVQHFSLPSALSVVIS
jgi:hypothetical protein